MIAVVDVAVQAANVSMPLFPWRAFRNSYSSVRVRNVPRKIGKWNITNVTVQVTYPDGSIKTADAVLTGGVWVATVEGTATAGTSIQGYKILASGIDENGQPVSNYCLGRGDVTILEDDGELIPENVITYTRLLSAEPTTPKEGDLWQTSGSWYIYQDGTAYPIGDDSGLISQLSAELSSKADVSSLNDYELTSNMTSDVSSIVLSVDSKPTGWIATPATFLGTPITFNIFQDDVEHWSIMPMAENDLGTPQTYTGQDKTYVWTYDWTGYHDYGPLSATFQQGYSRNALGLVTVDELSSKADVSSLNDYELTANMQTDVSSIVLSTETTESWDYQLPQGITEQSYQITQFDYSDSDMMWFLRISINDVGDLDWYSYQPSTDTNIVFDDGQGFESFGTAYATKHTTTHNALGLAMLSDLSSKQDKLSDSQISAIDSVVDERATVITFTDNTTSAFNWSGTITKYTMIDAGLFDGDEDSWIKPPVSVKIGRMVTAIGQYAFGFAFNLSSMTIPDSVTSIGDYAFYDCEGLTRMTIPDSVTSIGESAFEDCSGLANVTMLDNGLHNLKTIGAYAFKGCINLPSITLPQGVTSIGVDAFADNYAYFKLYLTEAVPAFVPSSANYPWGISNTAYILTIRNASQEWVEQQAYGKGFVWRNATVNARMHTCSINAFNINAMTLSTAGASFKVTMNATAYTTARDLYFALTIGNFTQPMTWDTPFDMFEGGSAAAIAPKPNTTNIYHIFEYASGHFMVSKFSSALDELGDIETIVNAI